MNSKFPHARYEDIVVQELAEEVLVCDLTNNRVSCLNITSAEVWSLCDGKRSVSDITQTLQKTFSLNVTEDLVLLALDQLSRENLLAEKVESTVIFNGVSRREVIKRVGLASMIALPIVSSIVMPTAAQAQSGCPTTNAPAGCPCTIGTQCTSGCCLENFPGPSICGSTFGVQGCICTSNAQCDTNSFTCCAPSNPVCNPGC